MEGTSTDNAEVIDRVMAHARHNAAHGWPLPAERAARLVRHIESLRAALFMEHAERLAAEARADDLARQLNARTR